MVWLPNIKSKVGHFNFQKKKKGILKPSLAILISIISYKYLGATNLSYKLLYSWALLLAADKKYRCEKIPRKIIILSIVRVFLY